MSSQRPYNDPDYRAARRWLKANPDTPCWHPDCPIVATTIDHVPALAQHQHRRGGRCCRLMPCCAPHNYSSGALLGNQNREPHTERWWLTNPDPQRNRQRPPLDQQIAGVRKWWNTYEPDPEAAPCPEPHTETWW